MYNTDFFVYNLEGELLGKTDISSFLTFIEEKSNPIAKTCATTLSRRIRTALLGDKGYGYILGYFVSYRKVTILNIEEQKKFTDNYFKLSYNRLMAYFKSTKEWDEDVFSDTLLYIYSKIAAKRGVNNIEKTFKFKYFRTLVDNGRKRAKAFIFNDFDIVDSEGNSIGFVELSSESATVDSSTDNCLHQVNDLKMADLIKDAIYTSFKKRDADLYLDYIENFKNVRKIGEKSGFRGVAEKYAVSVSTAKNKVKMINEFLKAVKDEIVDRYNDAYYPDFDSLTLRHFIDNDK